MISIFCKFLEYSQIYYSLEMYLSNRTFLVPAEQNSCDMEQSDFKIFMTLHFLRAVKLSSIIFVVVIESKTPIYKVFWLYYFWIWVRIKLVQKYFLEHLYKLILKSFITTRACFTVIKLCLRFFCPLIKKSTNQTAVHKQKR